MFFPFTFNLQTPFTNPFDAPNPLDSADPGQPDYDSPQRTRARRPPPPPRVLPQSSPERTGLSRKRGRWSPDAKARACSPTADLTSTASAYIDTHGTYVDLGGSDRVDFCSGVPNELRPVKRRRIAEITDSLISTAFSAAVIGTAVGLTAYRLWRDRGKDGLPSNPGSSSIEHLPPPPPYTERPLMQSPAGPSYVPAGSASFTTPAITPTTRRTSARPSTGGRRPQAQSARRRRPVSAIIPRNQSPAVSLHRPTSMYQTAPDSARSTPGPSTSSLQHNPGVQSGDELDDDAMEVSGQMDWMSAQLQSLINEGKKALGSEVVVGGADEVDDGADGWDDDEPAGAPSQTHSSTSSGATRTAARTPNLGRSSSRASGAARLRLPRARSGSASGPSPHKMEGYEDEHGFEVLYQTPLRSAPSTKTAFSSDDGTSEELRVAMERVRKAYGLR